MEKNIAVVCGDERNLYVFKKLKKEDDNVIYITEKEQLNQLEKAKIIIGPIPFTKDGKCVFSNNSKCVIKIEELFSYCKGKQLIGGAIDLSIYELAKKYNIEIIDLMKNESLAILNTIATAEGAIEIAIRKTKINIHGSNVLILGYGRVGKVVAQKFAGLSANITCAVRKKEACAWIEANGYKYTNINELGENLKQYDIIINTPQALILNKERLKRVKKDCLVIDLASKPGGVDREYVKKLNINFEWALALPGKVSPLSSAEYIKRVIDEFVHDIDKKPNKR